jgi:hypothetical protein
VSSPGDVQRDVLSSSADCTTRSWNTAMCFYDEPWTAYMRAVILGLVHSGVLHSGWMTLYLWALSVGVMVMVSGSPCERRLS